MVEVLCIIEKIVIPESFQDDPWDYFQAKEFHPALSNLPLASSELWPHRH